MRILLNNWAKAAFVLAAVAMMSSVSSTQSLAAAKKYPPIGPLPKMKAPKASLVEMGKRLFFDARISGDGGVSCAFCHDPAQGFGKSKDKKGKLQRLSEAYPGTEHFRNAPTLINTVYKARFANVGWGWDGHIGANLNDVVRNEITETAIMNMDMRIMHERMKQDPVYVKMCKVNFGGDCSSGKARKALVAFMATLVSKSAPFDIGRMSAAARRGRALFVGKANCIACHSGSYFSDGKPHNTGVPENFDVFKNPVRHLTYRSILHNHGVPNMSVWRRDVGYFLVSKKYGDVGKFITPTLRELKYTAPYMHNGMFATLAEVIAFYNRGGGKDDPLARELKPLRLNARESKDLVAFLLSLSSPKPVTVTPVKVDQKYPAPKNWLKTRN